MGELTIEIFRTRHSKVHLDRATFPFFSTKLYKLKNHPLIHLYESHPLDWKVDLEDFPLVFWPIDRSGDFVSFCSCAGYSFDGHPIGRAGF